MKRENNNKKLNNIILKDKNIRVNKIEAMIDKVEINIKNIIETRMMIENKIKMIKMIKKKHKKKVKVVRL